MFKINITRTNTPGIPSNIPRLELSYKRYEVRYISSSNKQSAVAFVKMFTEDGKVSGALTYQWTGIYWKLIKDLEWPQQHLI